LLSRIPPIFAVAPASDRIERVVWKLKGVMTVSVGWLAAFARAVVLPAKNLEKVWIVGNLFRLHIRQRRIGNAQLPTI
jgi:hypothetical protein